ncbi:unnamed protein product [Clonostachys rosea]|uniref:AB hydrolase-1 domain-containing protein n=1 Tax=Bionectria ochroleuca TaxID=29856 RepID=A0ABY6TPU0_BIOOC|nr:unnamed protein product [Clonostachys rosea]
MIKTLCLKHGIKAIADGQHVEWMVFLPGWPQLAEAFLPLFPDLSTKFSLIALDPPGLGGSAPPPGNDYTTASISRVVHESIDDTQKGPVHLVAHDIGAWIAYAWAAQYPWKIASLTLIDGAIPGRFPPLQYPLSNGSNIKLFQFSFNSLPGLPELLVAEREGLLLDWLFANKSVHPDRIPQESRRAYTEAYSSPGAMSRAFGYYRAVEESASAGVGSGMESMAKELADNVQGAIIEDCGHFVMEEQPKELLDLLFKFQKTIRRESFAIEW